MGNRQPSTAIIPVPDLRTEFMRQGVRSKFELGRGAYGRVLKARYNGSVRAVKEIHSILIYSYTMETEERRRLLDGFQRECDNCKNLNHPNIVDFIEKYHPPTKIFPVLIMELMDENLTTYVTANRAGDKPNIIFKIRLSILHDVAEGLGYLHSRDPPVIHRDLSPNNILLKYMPILPVAKISDLGVAKIINASGVVDKLSKKYQTRVPGTLDFMPPEAFSDSPKYDISLDVFSYGGIILHTVNGQWPRPAALTKPDPVTCRPKALTEVERRQEYLDMMTGEATVLRPLVEACLDNNPRKRGSIIELSRTIKALKVC